MSCVNSRLPAMDANTSVKPSSNQNRRPGWPAFAIMLSIERRGSLRRARGVALPGRATPTRPAPTVALAAPPAWRCGRDRQARAGREQAEAYAQTVEHRSQRVARPASATRSCSASRMNHALPRNAWRR